MLFSWKHPVRSAYQEAEIAFQILENENIYRFWLELIAFLRVTRYNQASQLPNKSLPKSPASEPIRRTLERVGRTRAMAPAGSVTY
jgi:hypothetical protein